MSEDIPRQHPPTDRGRAYMAAYLTDQDVKCDTCGYSLRGCTTDVCPECGKTIVLPIDRSMRASAAWRAALVLYSIATALTGVPAIFVLLALATGPMNSTDLAMFLAIGSSCAVALSGLLFVIFRKSVILAWRIELQAALVLSIVLVPIVAIVVGFVAARLL